MIFQLVAGERYVYKFVCSPEALFNMAYANANSPESSSGRNGNSVDKTHYFNQNFTQASN